MTPCDILHNATLGADFDVVARFHDAHERHLQAAYEVGERVLEAE